MKSTRNMKSRRNMYLNVDGVVGESTDAGHPQWIDALSFYWGAAQCGGHAVSDACGGVAFNDLFVQTVMDKAASALLRHCASGGRVSRVELSLCDVNQGNAERSRLILEDVLVSKIDFGTQKDRDVVTVTYGFRAMAVRHHYWSPTPQGTRGTESMSGWDRRDNRAL